LQSHAEQELRRQQRLALTASPRPQPPQVDRPRRRPRRHPTPDHQDPAAPLTYLTVSGRLIRHARGHRLRSPAHWPPASPPRRQHDQLARRREDLWIQAEATLRERDSMITVRDLEPQPRARRHSGLSCRWGQVRLELQPLHAGGEPDSSGTPGHQGLTSSHEELAIGPGLQELRRTEADRGLDYWWPRVVMRKHVPPRNSCSPAAP